MCFTFVNLQTHAHWPCHAPLGHFFASYYGPFNQAFVINASPDYRHYHAVCESTAGGDHHRYILMAPTAIAI
jgi:hypothetical protein